MYNTNYVVKYHDIEAELVHNLYRKAQKKCEEEAAAIIAKAQATILQKEKEIKELMEKQQVKDEPAPKKKGGRKKKEDASAEVTVAPLTVTPLTVTPLTTEPKKKGRKKKVTEEVVNEVPVINEVTKNEVPVINEVTKNEVPVINEVTKNEVPVILPDTKKEENDNDDEEFEYSMDDVHLICEKLYRDELLSVFGVDTINDENMDKGIKRVIEKMVDNENFRQLLEDIKKELVDFSSFTGTETEMENIRRNSDYIIFITLFSQHVFYITHKCICQLFTNDNIDHELMIRLKEKTLHLFKK